MRRRILHTGYLLCHILLFTALFLPPVFIPNHSMPDGGEYGLWLAVELWPPSMLLTGALCALIPGISCRVRIFSPAAGVVIVWICLLLSGSWVRAVLLAGLIYGVLYVCGFFAMGGIAYLMRSLFGGYREFRGKGVGK